MLDKGFQERLDLRMSADEASHLGKTVFVTDLEKKDEGNVPILLIHRMTSGYSSRLEITSDASPKE